MGGKGNTACHTHKNTSCKTRPVILNVLHFPTLNYNLRTDSYAETFRVRSVRNSKVVTRTQRTLLILLLPLLFYQRFAPNVLGKFVITFYAPIISPCVSVLLPAGNKRNSLAQDFQHINCKVKNDDFNKSPSSAFMALQNTCFQS